MLELEHAVEISQLQKAQGLQGLALSPLLRESQHYKDSLFIRSF